MSKMFPFEQFNFGAVPVPGCNSSSMSFESEDEWNTAQQSQLCGAQNRGVFGNADFISSELGFSQYNTTEEQLQQFSSIGSPDDIFDVVAPAFHEDIQSEISKLIEPQKMEKEFSFPFASVMGASGMPKTASWRR